MKRKLALTALYATLLACSHDIQLMKVEDVLSSYGGSIRWGLFEKAADFQKHNDPSKLDLQYLKTIHVTAYDPVYRKELDERNKILQTVEIRYYQEQTGVEHMITDHQTWEYDKEKDQWFLTSALPDFR
jgi:hypothetical protein